MATRSWTRASVAALAAGAVLAGTLALGAAPAAGHACEIVHSLHDSFDLRTSGRALSDDGATLVFTDTIDPFERNGDGSYEVFELDWMDGPDGTYIQHTIAGDPELVDGPTAPVLSGDGTTLAYVQDGEVHVHKLAHHGEELLFTDAEGVVVTSIDQDGDALLAVVEDEGETGLVWWHDGTTTDIGPRVDGSLQDWGADPATRSWSLAPDGTTVAAVHPTGPGSADQRVFLYGDGAPVDLGPATDRHWVELAGSSPTSLFVGTTAIVRRRTPPTAEATTVVPPRADAQMWTQVARDGEHLLVLVEHLGPGGASPDAPSLSPSPFGAELIRFDLARDRQVPIDADGVPLEPLVRSADADLNTLLVGIPQPTSILECGSFTDVPPSHPFSEEIEWAFEQEISDGYADGRFGVAAPVSRQAMAAFLHRFSGDPDPTPAGPTFGDVDEDHPFYLDVEWAAAEGITGGYADGGFHPLDPVTRQATAAFLHRLTGDAPPTLPDEPTFSDVPDGHPFYEDVEWLAENEITTGYADGTFRPANTVTRQAMAAYLFRTSALV